MDTEMVLEAYIVAALWSTNDESDETGGEPLDSNYSASDMAPEAVKSFRQDVEAFLVAMGPERMERYAAAMSGGGYTAEERLGHDLWLTRNGHGAGFWDRDYGDDKTLGDELTSLCKGLGEVYLYVHDNQIYRG